MSLRDRFALHWRGSGGLSEGTGAERVAERERGAIVELSRGTAAAPAPREPTLDRHVSPRPGLASPSRTGPAERLVSAPELRARGTAYGHGVYRLFVRGRAARGPLELPRVSGVDVTLTRGPLELQRVSGVDVTLTGELSPRPVAAPTRREPSSISDEPAATRSDPAIPRNEVVTPRPAAPLDPHDFGPDRGGYLRRVVLWPHAQPRPALLGGALARLELPDRSRCAAMLPGLLARAAPAGSAAPVVFLDVETTALDRGAGAIAFMIGIAVLVDGGLQIEQWILTRLSSEGAMLTDLLTRLATLAGAGAVLSTFNGASFDLPLLRARLRRAGLSSLALERPHLDLLPPARRMWRGNGADCRLGTLERTQLGVRRVHDIAGHEIPAVFWAWLRRPDDHEVQAVMRRVADHNLADLVTLPALAAALHAAITAPADLDAAVRAAEHHLAAGRRREALALLERWHPRVAPSAQRRRALLLAADLLRREPASRGRAAQLWAEVCRISPATPPRMRPSPSISSTTLATQRGRWRSPARRRPRAPVAWSASSASSSLACRPPPRVRERVLWAASWLPVAGLSGASRAGFRAAGACTLAAGPLPVRCAGVARAVSVGLTCSAHPGSWSRRSPAAASASRSAAAWPWCPSSSRPTSPASSRAARDASATSSAATTASIATTSRRAPATPRATTPARPAAAGSRSTRSSAPTRTAPPPSRPSSSAVRACSRPSPSRPPSCSSPASPPPRATASASATPRRATPSCWAARSARSPSRSSPACCSAALAAATTAPSTSTTTASACASAS
ncbi:MAG: ribonuclease H-like domain-containing protein [Nannocystis sp.]|nr:ribonuclease H-like domain-containing protein [Nannocystis sp.]